MTPMQQIKQRLIELGVPPEKIVGCTEAQIEEVMRAQGVSRLPEIYLDLLRVMGQKSGDFMWDWEYCYPALLMSKKNALEELQNERSPLTIPDDAFIFFCHDQGYTFLFFHTQCVATDTEFYRYLDDQTFTRNESLLAYWQQMLRGYEDSCK